MMDAVTIQRRRWAILGVLVLSLLVVVLDTTILNVALKTIADPVHGLGADQTELEWATDSYTLVFAGLLFTTGVLGDRLGRKKLLVSGMVLFGAGSALAAYSTSPGQLIAFRALMGAGGAMIMPSTLSIISNVFEPHERAKAIGIWSGAAGVGVALGPVTGGLLLEHFWWGSVFLVNVPLVAVAAVAMIFLVPDSRDPAPGRLDPLGVLLSVLGLSSLVFGLIRGGDLGRWTDPQVWGPIVAGLAVLAAFVGWEARTDHPVLRLSLFRSAGFCAAVSVVALLFLALTGVTFFLSFYLQNVRGYSALQTGLCFLPFAVGQILFAARSAPLAARYGARVVCGLGMVVATASFAAFVAIGEATSLWLLLALMAASGAGIGLVIPPAINAVMRSVPKEKAGEGSAVANTMRQVGGALGIAVLGSVLTRSYSDRIGPYLDRVPGLPAGARHDLSQSVASTMGFVDSHPRAAFLAGPARDAFVHAMHTAALWSVAVGLVGVVVTFLWMPRRQQAEAVPERAVPERAVRERAGETAARPVAEIGRE